VARTLLATRSVVEAWPEYKGDFPNGRRFWDKYFGHTAQIALGQDPEALAGELYVCACVRVYGLYAWVPRSPL
jgi:hypothetical protein